LIGLGSIVACTIVIASFALFAVNQTGQASAHQEQTLGEVASSASGGSSKKATGSQKSSVRKAIDEASEWLTSPFVGVTSGSHSEWAIRGADLMLALVVYGFGAGFLARALRVRL
jgi:hypothetical protein